MKKEPGKRGGDRGGRRPAIGPARSIHIPNTPWDFCLAQPQGASTFVRGLIERERASLASIPDNNNGRPVGDALDACVRDLIDSLVPMLDNLTPLEEGGTILATTEQYQGRVIEALNKLLPVLNPEPPEDSAPPT